MTAAQETFTQRVLKGEIPAIARMISRAEAGAEGAANQMAELYRAGGGARILGITGSPGSGKSTLVSALTRELRRRGRTVGIVAVDPSSPFSAGAILGDRIRLGEHAGDPGVFIRSMATRGTLGGLSRATIDAVNVLDAAGRDVVVIETVGVGQDEVDIVTAAHTAVVVSVPGLGDDIQAIKAGVIEIADIHAVNKADRDGADRTAMELKTMLNLGGATPRGGWKPPVLKVVAARGDGVPELLDQIDRHWNWLEVSAELAVRERQMAARRIQTLATKILVDQLRDPAGGAAFEAEVEATYRRRTDPFSAASRLIGRLA